MDILGIEPKILSYFNQKKTNKYKIEKKNQ